MPDGPSPYLSLLILCAPSAEAMPGAEVLRALGLQASITSDPVAAAARLVDQPKARLVILCPDPVAWVAMALAAGEAPSQAVATWRVALGPLMDLLRARRRQTVLLFDQTFADSPAACTKALGLVPNEGTVPRREADDPVLVMISREALRRDPVAQALAEELCATAFTLEDSDPDQTPDAVFSAYRGSLQQQARIQISLVEAEARLGALEAETTLLRDQIRLDDAARQEMQAALTAAQRATGSADAARGEAEARLAEMEAEATLLRDQIRLEDLVRQESQATLAAAQQATGIADTARRAAEGRLSALEAEMALLRDQARLDAAAHQEALTALQAKITAADAARAGADALHANLQAEADLLRDQIRLDGTLITDMQAAQKQAEQMLESTRREGQAALAAAEERSSQMIRHLREQIHQIGQGLESYHAQVDALQTERADLLGQIRHLHGAREDLEVYYDRACQLSDQVDMLTQDVGRLQADLSVAQSHVATGQHHAQFLEAEIARIHRSRSYRAAHPLRKIRKMLG